MARTRLNKRDDSALAVDREKLRAEPSAQERDNTLEEEAEAAAKEFSSLLRIDKNDLDSALEMQADTFFRVSDTYTRAVSMRDLRKTELERVSADVELDLRHDARVAEEKTTEAEIKSNVVLDKEVQAAQAALQRWTRIVNLYAALKESFSQRSYALKDMANLYVAGYFGDRVTSAAQAERSETNYRENRRVLGEERRKRREEG